jgi:hypothetical protein
VLRRFTAQESTVMAEWTAREEVSRQGQTMVLGMNGYRYRTIDSHGQTTVDRHTMRGASEILVITMFDESTSSFWVFPT